MKSIAGPLSNTIRAHIPEGTHFILVLFEPQAQVFTCTRSIGDPRLCVEMLGRVARNLLGGDAPYDPNRPRIIIPH